MLAAQIFKATIYLKSRGFGNLQTLTICSSVSRNQLHWKDTQSPQEMIRSKIREPQLGTSARKKVTVRNKRSFYISNNSFSFLQWHKKIFSITSVFCKVRNWISEAKFGQFIGVSHGRCFLTLLIFLFKLLALPFLNLTIFKTIMKQLSLGKL